jgi:hypothetical protein
MRERERERKSEKGDEKEPQCLLKALKMKLIY